MDPKTASAIQQLHSQVQGIVKAQRQLNDHLNALSGGVSEVKGKNNLFMRAKEDLLGLFSRTDSGVQAARGDLQRLANDVASLRSEVNRLSSDVSSLQSKVEDAKAMAREAQRRAGHL